MKNTKLFLALLLVAVLFVTLAACGETNEPVKSDAVESEAVESDAAETDAEPYETVTEGDGEAVKLASSEERIALNVIYGTGVSYRITGAAYSVRDNLPATSKKGVKCLADEDGPAPDAEAIEILVGNSDRPESAAALQGLHKNEYSVTFDGKMLVINAFEPYGVQYAARLFVEKYVKDKTEVSLKAGFAMKGTYEVPETVRVIDSMKRGFNVHNSYHPWGQEEYMYAVLKGVGFDHVRLPLDLSTCFDENGDLVDDVVTAVDNAVRWSLDAGLTVLLDFHAFSLGDGKNEETNGFFYGIWEFFAERYKDLPTELCFALINEPDCTPARLDEIQTETYRRIRAIDEDRIVVFTSVWGEPSKIDKVTIPENDDAVMLDIHNYVPLLFTHQGYDGRPVGVSYTQDCFDQWSLLIDNADEYRHQHGIPIIVGEFGVIPEAEDDDETAFLCDTTKYLEDRDLPWTNWEFAGIKYFYDQATDTWLEIHLNGLMTDDYLRFYKK